MIIHNNLYSQQLLKYYAYYANLIFPKNLTIERRVTYFIEKAKKGLKDPIKNS